MSNLFSDNDAKVFNGNISGWDTHNVTNMSYMFSYSQFNGDISRWDTSQVLNMKDMFFYSVFNSDISSWNVSNVTNMELMFVYSRFNGDISQWNIDSLKNSEHMFTNCKNNYIPLWANKDIEKMKEYKNSLYFNNELTDLLNVDKNSQQNNTKDSKKLKI